MAPLTKGDVLTIVQGPARWDLAAAVVESQPDYIPYLLTFSTKDDEHGERYFTVLIRNITQMSNAREAFGFEGLAIELDSRDALQAGNSPALKELWKQGPRADVSIQYFMRNKYGTIRVIRPSIP